MSDFDATRSALETTRKQWLEAQDELAAARQATARLEARRAAASRTLAPRSEAMRELDVQLEEARADEAAKRALAVKFAVEAAKRAGAFAEFADPRVAITHWSDETPILLLPVRLETRFKSIKDAAGTREELWVRIYPDECSVDTFEAALSETEIESARRYWIETWAAGGSDAQRRAAWRNLVASHGAGRAAWIVHEFAPAGAVPAKAKPEDIVLVIATDAPPRNAEQTALAVYWKAVWLAEADQAKIEAATRVLVDTPGVADAAQLVARFEPTNLTAAPTPPAKRTDVDVSVGWLRLPAAVNAKTRSWTAPARVQILPDRFIVLGYQGDQIVFEAAGGTIPSPLVAGPDPSVPADQQLRHDAAGGLNVPNEMRWMVDFDAAVNVGMGIKVPLDPARVNLAQPIQRVIAVGVRLADDDKQSSARLEELLTHHRYSRTGFALVPQGTPTNNTDGAAAGYGRMDDADAAYDALFGDAAQLVPTPDWWQRRDGQWLADALGVDPRVFDRVSHASGTDFAEARAMNRALWPATFGYALETMLHPVFGAQQVDATRWFYTHFVAGRGMLPSVRIGDQPYGVLPISAISQWQWLGGDRIASVGGLQMPPEFIAYRQGLATLLMKMRVDWAQLAQAVSFVGKSGDPHQLLLDVLGLHPASVEFHQRYAESLDHIFNRVKLQGLAEQIYEYIRVQGLQHQAMQLLRKLGYAGEIEPDALSKFFFTHANRLNGPIIDDRPLSEQDAIRAYTVDDRNYIAWLADAGRGSFEDLRQEHGFKDNRSPDALLYVMLRHALLLGYWDSGLRLHLAVDMLTPDAAAVARREPAFVHVANNRGASESRYTILYSTDARVTQATGLTVAERIGAVLGADETQGLADQLAALDLLKNAPTARLERCLAEHIDTASFRLDAWLLGLVNYQLAALRYRPTLGDRDVEATRGIHLGAYGWLENLHRKTAPLQAVDLKGELAKAFSAATRPHLMHDPDNGGYVFAPSINQATTAAILRAGYLANATPRNPETLAVNLSSARVRVALGLIEGIRNGQPLGALLGYRLQRGLHERHGALELDRFIYPLRKQFPLVADQMRSTQTPQGVSIEAIEANNVVDGLKLIDHVRKTGNRTYPFGVALPSASAAERAAIDSEVDALLDAQDALADLALAEGVHQAVLGNYDRVAATLDAYSKGTFPPEPEVVRTPRSGLGLTHRVGLHFEAGVDPDVSPVVGMPVSPRARAQAMVNKWLYDVLPDPDEVACLVQWFDPAANAIREDMVTQRALGLQPIDLLYLVALDGTTALGELDDRIVSLVIGKHAPRADATISIRHTARLPAPLKSFFEIASLVRHLRSLLLRSRPLAPTDIALAGEADRRDDATQSIAPGRVQRVWEGLDQLRQDLDAFHAAAMTVDEAINAVVALFERAARFGIQQVGWGFVYEWRRSAFAGLLGQVQEVITRWEERLVQFDQRMAHYGAHSGAMSIEERFTVLAQLDLLLAALPVTPRPPDPRDYEDALVQRRQPFFDKLARLKALLTSADPRLASLVAAVQAELPLTAFDNTPFPIEFTLAELRNAVQTFTDRWTDRLARSDMRLNAYNNLPAGTTDHDRLVELEKLYLLVAARELTPRPASPAAYLAAVTIQRTAFDAKLTQLKTLLQSTDPRPQVFLAALRPKMPLTAFDETPLLLDKLDVEVDHTISDLRSRVDVLKTEVARRLKSAAASLQTHDASADPGDRVRALQEAGSALLGEDVKLIPEFRFGAQQSAELANAIIASSSGALTEYLRTHTASEFPVDDWLHGVARVREKLHAWEQATALAATFGRAEPGLVPLQLPYRAGEGWLAMEFDPATALDGERLLYTAHYAVAPDAVVPTCGVLLDEWTEVVPRRDETAGLAFHYDRPGSEPPQTWLLVTPAQMQGRWQWADLVGALHETLDLARLRAVEPAHVDTQTYARFLPATTGAVTLYGISIAANYSRVNGVLAQITGGGDG